MKNFLKVFLIILCISAFAFLILFIRFHNDPKSKIINRPDCTLVIVYTEDNEQIGYIKKDKLKDFLNHVLDENIELYHPYIKEKSSNIDFRAIKSIMVISKDELISLYPPN